MKIINRDLDVKSDGMVTSPIRTVKSPAPAC